jgi:PKD repeat protein
LVASTSNGCKDSVTKQVVIFAKPVVDFSATNRCLGNSINFSNLSSGATGFVWNFGDGKTSATTSPSYTYASSGTYNVKLIAENANGCKDSVSKSITVFSNPSVSFTAQPNPICRGGLMNFTNTSTNGTSFTWNFGNGKTSTLTSPTNIYTAEGNYNVKLVSINSNGCKDSTFRTVTVWPRPKASFSFNNGCATDNLGFTSNSVGAVGHSWTFGDATTSTQANPAKGYTGPGTYSVTLIVTSVNGCMDTTTSSVTVHPRAAVSFTNPTNFCAGNAANFTNTSTLSAGNMTFQWKFGDGNSSSLTSPSNTYANGGNYIVTLTATTDKGCVNTATGNVLVFAKPTANFNAKDVCQGTAMTFNNTSVGGTTWLWDFGDATTSTSASPTKTYTNAGTYTVKLTATNGNNCSDVYSMQVTVNPNPVASFTAADKCYGQAVNFTNTSTNANDVYWNFGDGNTSNSFNPSYNYPASGTYNVTLNVESNFGCTGSITKSVTVYAAPKVSFSVNDAGQCVNGNAFVFTDNSTIASGTMSRSWTLGDGGTSTASPVNKTYALSGNYNVKLVVTGPNGCKDSATDIAMVYPKPQAGFTSNNQIQCYNNHLFVFTDATTISSGTLTRTWDFGDGTTAGGVTVNKQYASTGSYTVKLSVTSENGCTDNTTKSVTVNPSPSAGFSINNATQCLNGNNFVFTNSTSGATGFSSSWKMGDGSTAATANASRTYATAGNYRVTLSVNTAGGCSDSAYYFVKVLANPAALTITGPSPAAMGSKQTYSVAYNAGSSYNWTATNGTVLSNGSSTIQVKWNITGATGSLSVTETATNGCIGAPASYNVSLYDAASVSSLHNNAFGVKLYPNPAKNQFSVEVSTGEMVNMVVYNQLGKVVLSDIVFNDRITITDHNLAAGIYTAKLSTSQGKSSILRFEIRN